MNEKQAYEDLANAVVIQAVQDYHHYKKKIEDKESANYEMNLQCYNEVCDFLFTDKLEAYTSIPVEVLLKERGARKCRHVYMQASQQ